VATDPRSGAGHDHLVVCGDDALALRTVELALLNQDDLGNFHAALRAQELNPDLRLVLAIFNTGQLHDLGIGVVCVDKRTDAAGVPLARRLGLKIVFGETQREETLRAAGIDSSRALVSVTNSDIANLETALNARALSDNPRLVVRLLDDDLAARVGKTIANSISRSVSYLAAPSFAAAMLEHQVLRTIAVGRHVLLIAEVQVGSGAELAGQRFDDVHTIGEVRVIAIRRTGAPGVDWSPRRDYPLAAGDRLVVLATRAGLGRFLAHSRPR